MNPRRVRPSVKDEIPLELFDLDTNKLDRHCIDQPKLVMEWGLKLADAKDQLDRAKAAYDLSQAEAAKEIADNPNEYGLSKNTVDQVKAAVARHEDVQVALGQLQRRRHDVDVLQAVMVALEHRKRSIEGLIQLNGQEYYSVPIVSGKNRERMNEQTKQTVRRMRQQREDNDA